jgi:hypothetical protein
VKSNKNGIECETQNHYLTKGNKVATTKNMTTREFLYRPSLSISPTVELESLPFWYRKKEEKKKKNQKATATHGYTYYRRASHFYVVRFYY